MWAFKYVSKLLIACRDGAIKKGRKYAKVKMQGAKMFKIFTLYANYISSCSDSITGR